MSRLQRKAEKAIEREFVKEILALLTKAEKKSGEEWEISKEEILKKLEEKQKELEGEIEKYQVAENERAWDFSKEKALEVFAENDEVLLRFLRDEEKESYIQLKKETMGSPKFYGNELNVQEMWEDFNAEQTFYCSIIRKVDGKFLGYIGIKNTKSNLWEIAMELLQEHCHHGYGTMSLELFVTNISKTSGKTQFQALVETDNIPSQKMVEKIGAKLIDIYDFTFHGDEEAMRKFEEEHLEDITDRMRELAEELEVEPRRMLSHVLDYRICAETN